MVYLWTKTLHLLFVISWMAALFYLPRILVNMAEAGDVPAVRERLSLMGRRLVRFGHAMFGFATLLGVLLWQGHRLSLAFPDVGSGGGWMHAKLSLVALLLAYFIVCARMLRRGAQDLATLPSATALRWVNELPVFVLVAIIYLVLAKPF